MRMGLYTNIVSPHQIPLSRELVRFVGAEHFRYVATVPQDRERSSLGWNTGKQEEWITYAPPGGDATPGALDWLESCDVLLSGHRAFDLHQRRAEKGLATLYMSERWFKPPTHQLRLLHPSYFRMAKAFLRSLQHPGNVYLPIGPHAAADIRCLAKLFRHIPGNIAEGVVLPEKLLAWAYFVDKPSESPSIRQAGSPLNILWGGRYLRWKRVDILLRAAAGLRDQGVAFHLNLLGQGPQEQRLRTLCQHLGLNEAVTFHPPVPIAEVRDWMGKSDIYVLPSNAEEGWGAVVNEAMGEGCAVVASRESGSGPTLIQEGFNGLLFPSGKVQALTDRLLLLCKEPDRCVRLGNAARNTLQELWAPSVAAERLLAVGEALRAGKDLPRYDSGPLHRVHF